MQLCHVQNEAKHCFTAALQTMWLEEVPNFNGWEHTYRRASRCIAPLIWCFTMF